MRRNLLICSFLLLAGGLARGEVKPHVLFSDGAVLQQGGKVPVWGTAEDGEAVTVEMQGQKASTTARDGKWKVELTNLKPGGPYELTISGKNTVKVPNILVGEVWVASGQSNMEWSVNASADPAQVKAAAKYPQIRFFKVPHVATDTPQDTVAAKWVAVDPESVGTLSAVAYHFARDIHNTQKVPVGVLQTAWGGTICEAWASRPGLTANETIKKQILDPYDAAVKDGKKVSGPNRPTVLYNGMIAPLIPYAIKGAIWYQGESNAGRAYQYRALFPLMIEDWRKQWGQGDFPFLFVQLAPFMKIEPVQESNWAELREAQLMTLQRSKNTGQAVITDVGDEKDIHPKQKEPVGLRLALAARALAYGEKVVYSGPVYDSMKVDGNKVVLSFKHVGGGLVGKGGPLVGFTIAGEDKKFVKADAQILDDKVVVVSSPDVAKPVAVRYGWANHPVVNLWNKDGLPATPFRTDEFPGLTAPKTGTGGQ